MTRRDSRGQIFYVFCAISVARYLSRVCIIVVYYLPLGTFNLRHFLPRHTMPRRRRPGRIMSRNFRPLKFQLTMVESCPGGSLSPPPSPRCHPDGVARGNLPRTFVRPRVVCHRDRRKKFHRGRGNKKKYPDR